MNKYYVYEILHPKTSEPFYVGKGSGSRTKAYLSEDLNNVSRPCSVAIRELRLQKLEPQIHVVQDGLSEDVALDLEAYLIQKYGRIGYDPKGMLTNTKKRGQPQYNRSTKQYKTIHVDAAIKARLDRICKENHWPISVITEQLILKFIDGDLSGSLGDMGRGD